MSSSSADFILAGNASDLDAWPEVAFKAGVLWCQERQGSECGLPVCGYLRGCGIRDGLMRLDVIVVSGAANFNSESYERLLLVTPSKRDLNASAADRRELVRKLLLAFHGSKIACCESCRGPSGVEWARID